MTRSTASHDSAAPHHVLVIEDEPQMRAMLTDNLEYEGYRVTSVGSGEEALVEFDSQPFSLLLVDVMLPGMSGLEVCERLRGRGVRAPIIILTARSQEVDRINGLEMGADDYVSKPFSVRELLARVKAQVRRDDWHSRNRPGVHVRRRHGQGPATPHHSEGQANSPCRRASSSCSATYIAHRNEVVSREQLLRDVWGYHQFSVTRTVDNYIAKLRMQLEPRPHEPRYIVTVHGSGYELLV